MSKRAQMNVKGMLSQLFTHKLTTIYYWTLSIQEMRFAHLFLFLFVVVVVFLLLLLLLILSIVWQHCEEHESHYFVVASCSIVLDDISQCQTLVATYHNQHCLKIISVIANQHSKITR